MKYSYGSTGGASGIYGYGLATGVNGQHFSNGESQLYEYIAEGEGIDIGLSLTLNAAIYTGVGEADPESWKGLFNSYNFSVGGYTGSYFEGGAGMGWLLV